jgi:hypothetical protein
VALASNEFLLLPTRRGPSRRSSGAGRQGPDRSGQIYFDAITIRRAKLFEKLFPGSTATTLVPEESCEPARVNDAERLKRRTCGR